MVALQNPNRTILGAPQQKFLFDQLSEAQGSQTWKILGQQVRCCLFEPWCQQRVTLG